MDKIDFDRIRAMPPERKIKALREVQEKLTQLIKERSKEIEDSQREIKDAQDFLKEAEDELRVLEEMEEQAPKIKKVDVEQLFEREKAPEQLEAIAAQAPRTPSPQEEQAYINFLARQPVTSIYERINQIRDQINTTGVISAYQQEKLGQFREALHEKEEAIREGEYAVGKKSAILLTAAEKAIQYATEKRNPFYHTRHENQ